MSTILRLPDYVPDEWLERARNERALLQYEAAERDWFTGEVEPRNYFVVPAEHLEMVAPDSWSDVREGEGMLKEEREEQLYRKVSLWETFAWDNALDTDDFTKGPAVDIDSRGNAVLAPNDAWETTISDALEYVAVGDRFYA